nr:MAG TPA: hypothetical protein [Caudoviricetes sp.]
MRSPASDSRSVSSWRGVLAPWPTAAKRLPKYEACDTSSARLPEKRLTARGLFTPTTVLPIGVLLCGSEHSSAPVEKCSSPQDGRLGTGRSAAGVFLTVVSGAAITTKRAACPFLNSSWMRAPPTSSTSPMRSSTKMRRASGVEEVDGMAAVSDQAVVAITLFLGHGGQRALVGHALQLVQLGEFVAHGIGIARAAGHVGQVGDHGRGVRFALHVRGLLGRGNAVQGHHAAVPFFQEPAHGLVLVAGRRAQGTHHGVQVCLLGRVLAVVHDAQFCALGRFLEEAVDGGGPGLVRGLLLHLGRHGGARLQVAQRVALVLQAVQLRIQLSLLQLALVELGARGGHRVLVGLHLGVVVGGQFRAVAAGLRGSLRIRSRRVGRLRGIGGFYGRCSRSGCRRCSGRSGGFSGFGGRAGIGLALARVSHVVVTLLFLLCIEGAAPQGSQRCSVVFLGVVVVVVGFHGLALSVGQEAQVVVVQAHVCVLSWFGSRQGGRLGTDGLRTPATELLKKQMH